MEEFNKNIEAIRRVLKEKKAERYALVNPVLVELDEYMKSLYLRVLCSALQYESMPTEMQTLYLKRIVKGMEAEDGVQEYMRRALEISEQEVQEFLSIFGEKTVKFYFAVDGIVLSSLGSGNDKAYEYLAEILELLGITKSELTYLCLIARAILEQKSEVFDEAKEKLTDRVKELNFIPYVKNFYVGAIVDTDMEYYLTAPEKELSKGFEYKNEYRQRRVVFENLDIEVKETWGFVGCEEVVFRNCNLKGVENKNICFDALGSVKFEGCKIRDFKKMGFISLYDVNNLVVKNCEISECGYNCSTGYHVQYSRGGVIGTNNWDMTEIIIENNTILNCYIEANTYFSYRGVSGTFIGRRDGSSLRCDVMRVINNKFIGNSCKYNGEFRKSQISGTFKKIISYGNECTGDVTRVFEDYGDINNE